jgi:hypothetical protein
MMHFSERIPVVKRRMIVQAYVLVPRWSSPQNRPWRLREGVGIAILSLYHRAYARNIPSAVCVAPPENEQVMLKTWRSPWFSINWMKSASRWFHYTENLGSRNSWKLLDYGFRYKGIGVQLLKGCSDVSLGSHHTHQTVSLRGTRRCNCTYGYTV